MVTLRTCAMLSEAQTMQSVLAGSAIESFLPDELTVQNNWMWTDAMGGVRLEVRQEDAARADELLREAFPR
jgi:hypothetical protein